MKPHKFFVFLLVLLGIATGYYFYSTDRTTDTVLIGIVDANQVIVSSKIMGRVEKLYVDEGSKVKAGDLIAEIDSGELEAEKNAAQATIHAYDSQVSAMQATEAQTLGETNSGVVNAQARLASAKATLVQAKADLARIQSDSQRMIALAKAGVESDQDKVRAEEQLNAQQAVVLSAQKNVDAAQADLNTADGAYPSATGRRQQRCRRSSAGGQCAGAISRSRYPAGLHQNLRSSERNGFRARHPPGRSGESRRADRYHHRFRRHLGAGRSSRDRSAFHGRRRQASGALARRASPSRAR